MKKLLSIFLITLCCSFISSDRHLIQWEFDNFKKLTFSYVQTMHSKSSIMSDMSMLQELNGILVVHAKSPTHADVLFKELQMKMFRLDSLGDSSDVMTNIYPDMFIQDMKEDGSIDGELDGQTELLAKVLFPALPKAIAPGDSVDLPMMVPFNIMGSVIKVKGYNRVKYTGTTNESSTLNTIINVTDYTIPEDIKTKYICFLKGTSSFQFNDTKRYFTQGEITIHMGFGTEGEKKSDPDRLMMDMKSTIKLKLIKVE